MNRENNILQAHLFLFLVALIYGANYSIAKLILDPVLIEPNGFILCRIGVAFVLFRLFFGKMIRIDRKDWMDLIFLSITGVLTNQLLFFNGLSKTSPIHAALIMLITPLLVLIFSTFYNKVKFNKFQWIGCLLGFLGTYFLIISSTTESNSSRSSVIGDLMILANAVSYAIYLNNFPKLLIKYPPFEILKWIFALAFIMCLPFGFAEVLNIRWNTFNSTHWASFGFVLFATTFLTYLLNAKALQISHSGLVSNYIYLQPLLAILIAKFFGQDSLNLIQLMCGSIILLGLYLSSKK